MANTDFRETWLWRNSFVEPRTDANVQEQEFFRQHYLSMREKAAELVSCIASDMPGLTVHDISHLDALWDVASLLSEKTLDLNPAEAFVFGGAVLLHDAGLTAAAYPNGIADLKRTDTWKDIAAAKASSASEEEGASHRIFDEELVGLTLRRLHAQKAADLANQSWSTSGGPIYLIEEAELRRFYASSIGRIASSHWWQISRVENDFDAPLGAFQPYTRCTVNRLKVACLLRVADALHLDRRRAPSFRRAIQNPSGQSSHHWTFQERLASPHLVGDALVFTASAPFPLADAEAWWLAFDSIAAADKELSDTNSLLVEKLGVSLRASRVKGASSPALLSQTIPTANWIPVESKVHVSDVPKVVETLGGAKLYGDDPFVAIRELIQNGRDAIEARRLRQGRASNWGLINIQTFERDGQLWISVEDNGIGMSERVLTGPLTDFGNSLWSSPLLNEEFAGLASAGMRSVGRFGIGFFSVFMLGKFVRVVTRRHDRGSDDARVLEFRAGLKSRPILYAAAADEAPIDGGTRVEVQLSPIQSSRYATKDDSPKGAIALLKKVVAAHAPSADVSIAVNRKMVVRAGDWTRVSSKTLCQRLLPFVETRGWALALPISESMIRNIKDGDSRVVGRACIYPTSEFSPKAVVTVGGLSAVPAVNIVGLVPGAPLTAARDQAAITMKDANWAEWANEQAVLLKSAGLDLEDEIKVAEIVLECGGNPAELAILMHGDRGLSQSQLLKNLRELKQIRVHFGNLDHEDYDPVGYDAFNENLVIEKDLFVIPSYDGRIRSIRRRRYWDEYDFKKSKDQVARLFQLILRRAWKAYREEEHHEVVGSVDGAEIERYVTWYSREY